MTDDVNARMDAFQAACQQAAEALETVLLDPELGAYEPKRKALLDALMWLEIETTCGDCEDGDCHGAEEDDCGCARHEASVAARERRQRLAEAGVVADRSARRNEEGATAWHDLHLYLGPHLIDPGETTLVSIGHPDECRALPNGAVCWVNHTPLRESWPTELGRYRIRLIDYVDGGDEGGPNIVTALEVEPVPDEPPSP